MFTLELGKRLRELRVRAGLSQGQLMYLAGRRSRGAANLASRLERGKIPYPSFGLAIERYRRELPPPSERPKAAAAPDTGST